IAMKVAPIRYVQEDIAHDVFIDFMNKYDKWDYNPEKIRPLLRKMTSIKALQYWRKHLDSLPARLREATELIWKQPSAWESREESLWNEQMASLDICLQKLSSEERNLIDDYYLSEIDRRELAEKWNIKSGTLRMRVCRIRSMLFNCVNMILGMDMKDE
ncbi:MAG: sigma-70 family RNA polymerase sigma factor, partial [Thermoguttaceae bacterium]|nr:sigma-70 family RNA polymerase sigma factor [Thermoguttaceae bacterium]